MKEKKTEYIRVRLTTQERQRLEEICKVLQKSISDFVRQAILRGK